MLIIIILIIINNVKCLLHLVKRKINAEVSANATVKMVTDQAKIDIDIYRKSIGLKPKFEKVNNGRSE